MKLPLSRCAPSPVCTAPSLAAREGGMRATDDTFAAGHPWLGVPALGLRLFRASSASRHTLDFYDVA